MTPVAITYCAIVSDYGNNEIIQNKIAVFMLFATIAMVVATFFVALGTFRSKKEAKQRWLYERYINNAKLHDELHSISMEVISNLEKLNNKESADVSFLKRTMTSDISSSYSEKQAFRAWQRMEETTDEMIQNVAHLIRVLVNAGSTDQQAWIVFIGSLLDDGTSELIAEQISIYKHILENEKAEMNAAYDKAQAIIDNAIK